MAKEKKRELSQRELLTALIALGRLAKELHGYQSCITGVTCEETRLRVHYDHTKLQNIETVIDKDLQQEPDTKQAQFFRTIQDFLQNVAKVMPGEFLPMTAQAVEEKGTKYYEICLPSAAEGARVVRMFETAIATGETVVPGHSGEPPARGGR